MLPPTFEARLVSACMLSPQVRELTFERVDRAPMHFEAGQWVSVVVPLPTGEVRRAYSVASAPDGSPRLQLAITRVSSGPASSFLHELPVGEVRTFIGPQGFFTRGKGLGAPALFVATGTGVTPMRSMIRDAVRRGERVPLWLLFGVRHEHDQLYAEEFGRLREEHPNVRIEYTLSQPGPSWTGRRGYVQTHLRELWSELTLLQAGVPHVYACGLGRMVGSVRDVFRKELGLPREQVHGERYD